ncbi:TetR family transcriptional regulator [Nocardioides baekrokdamisoli]|uniref:TetR family transcriptional regulator n=1 Tax=Nocardioides baekrokdamisoli TaxID=1804624 RepID=A0A3G9J3P9_9ACTN|nr:TetR family transcriptional regulator [Nocardioides baekrokdamisoli]BBH18054.1 TetR family transcriptional regulator [Nocardioides baekrokdamisoli]
MTRRDGAALIRAAAERLIAERGIDVPLRDIAAAAHQRNNSAVQYHFGTRDRLITAIVEEGNAAPEARRLELLAEAETQAGGDEVRTLVELIVRPIAEIPYEGGSTHYARFLEQVRNHPAVLGDTAHWTLESPAMRIIMARLDRALAGTQTAALRRMRLTSMATAMFALLANRERELEAGDLDATEAEAATANIVDVLVAILRASPSPKVLAVVRDAH